MVYVKFSWTVSPSFSIVGSLLSPVLFMTMASTVYLPSESNFWSWSAVLGAKRLALSSVLSCVYSNTLESTVHPSASAGFIRYGTPASIVYPFASSPETRFLPKLRVIALPATLRVTETSFTSFTSSPKTFLSSAAVIGNGSHIVHHALSLKSEKSFLYFGVFPV